MADPDSRAVYEALRSGSAMWAAEEDELGRWAPQAALLLEDLFLALYAPAVELNPETLPAFAWNFAILAAMLPTAEYRRLRERTAGDPVTAAMAALHLAQALCSPDRRSPAVRRSLLAAWSRTGPAGQLAWLRLARPGRAPVALAAEMDSEGGYGVLRAMERAVEAVEAGGRLRAAWGIRPGVRTVHAVDDIWNLLRSVQQVPGFEELTDAFLRFGSLLRAASRPPRRRRPGQGSSRLAGFTLGGDLDRALPEEAVKLSDPDLEDLFREAYEHRRILQERFEGQTRLPAGPVVCCMDVSRSMNARAALGRTRFLWAKGIGLALLDVARRDGRRFLGLCFSGEQELAEFDVPAGAYQPEIALAMARCDFDGGTHFQTPLARALDYLQSNGVKHQSHLVFVTDGDAPLPQEFLDRFRTAKAEAGFRMAAVFIDGYHPGLAAVSDHTFVVRADRLDAWERAVAGVGRALNR